MCTGLDDVVEHFDVTPRQIIREHRPGGRRTGPAASGPHPLQQPGHAGQLDARRSKRCRPWKAIAGTSRTSSFTATAAAKPTRTRSSPRSRELADYVNAHPQPHGRRRPGAVRRHDQHDRRRPAGLLPAQRLRHQVVQRPTPRWKRAAASRRSTYKNKSLVHCPAMGDRPGVVSAGRTIPGGW